MNATPKLLAVVWDVQVSGKTIGSVERRGNYLAAVSDGIEESVIGIFPNKRSAARAVFRKWRENQ